MRNVWIAAALCAAALGMCGCSTQVSGTGQAGVTPTSATSGRPTTAVPTATTPRPSTATLSPSGSSSGSPSASPSPTLTKPVRTVSANGYTFSIWAEDQFTNCAKNAHGTEVVNYLTLNPCVSGTRQIVTTPVGSRTVVFTTGVVRFPVIGGNPTNAYKTASAFAALVTKDGTGDLTDLFSTGARIPNGPSAVPATVYFNAFSQDTGAEMMSVWYLTGTTTASDPALKAVADAAALATF